MIVRKLLCSVCLLSASAFAFAINYVPQNVRASVALKVPGNAAVHYPLALQKADSGTFDYRLSAGVSKLPLLIYQDVEEKDGKQRITVWFTATDDVYFHYDQQVSTGARHDDCLFYMPGFWYRRNLRSPKEAPSFHTSDSWMVREDRLSTPLTAIYDEKNRKTVSVLRLPSACSMDALTTHKEGEVILSGKTSLGYTGFENVNGVANLSFGFPYKEAPKTYIRKLTLAPEVEAYQHLKKGESLSLTWELREAQDAAFADCVQHTWEYSYDTYRPKPVHTPYTPARMKAVLSNYFKESFVDGHPLKFYSSPEMHVATCANIASAEIGFVGRTLLNAFNALEYGEAEGRQELVRDARAIFDSYLANGFSQAGFFNEYVRYHDNFIEPVHSIRRQSEGIYAVLYYLDYEKRHGRRHTDWENRLKQMLDMFLKLQKEDGSFPRKFKDDFSIVDESGGSTPSATLPLVMGYKYFKDKRYLESAKRTVAYLERELISKSDYFSSTLDANCEDKEASLYAATAAYYLALATKGSEKIHYADLAKKAAYFALSWYYTWDVPFAEGQMLGDLGLQSRGWGNVSVENNHIDVFVFDFADVLKWLSKQYDEPRFANFAEVIGTSMRQLLPYEGHLCGVGKPGFYPEVVQHTNWDYGRNGKGYYNNIFAPGWTVASLWELFSPGRAEIFLAK